MHRSQAIWTRALQVPLWDLGLPNPGQAARQPSTNPSNAESDQRLPIINLRWRIIEESFDFHQASQCRERDQDVPNVRKYAPFVSVSHLGCCRYRTDMRSNICRNHLESVR